jgi:mannose-6-phosphate isomerase-like protein (cupin superfamily)
MDRRKSDRLKEVVHRFDRGGTHEVERELQVHRPWGHYVTLADGPTHQVKELTIQPGRSISLQRHAIRTEHWVVLAGRAEVTLGEDTFAPAIGDAILVRPGIRHKLSNVGDTMLRVLEVQSGSYLGEDDIERIQ